MFTVVIFAILFSRHKIAVDPYPIAVGEDRVPAHDAADPDDAPAAVLADDQRRFPRLARLFQRIGLQVHERF